MNNHTNQMNHNNHSSDNTPTLRFPEFKGEWERKKLGEVADNISSGKSQTKIIEGEFPLYGSTGIIGYSNSYDYSGKKILVARVGANAGSLYKVIGNYCITDNTLILNFNEEINIEFTFNYLVKKNLNKLVFGSGQPLITGGQLKTLEISFPTLPEQTKIADFFTAIDAKIQALKTKKEKLQQYKKGVMQQLFSQTLKFKDENGNEFPNWEMKKLGEVAKITTGSTPSTVIEEYYNGNKLFVSPADIQGNRFVNKTKTTLTELGFSKGRLISKGSVLFVCIGSTIGKVAIANDECLTNQQINSLTANVNYNNDFIFSLLELNANEIKLMAGVQAVPQINKTDFSNLKYKLPCFAEQTKIANFLSSIDEKINYTETQIQQTQGWKKGLLQKMFV